MSDILSLTSFFVAGSLGSQRPGDEQQLHKRLRRKSVPGPRGRQRADSMGKSDHPSSARHGARRLQLRRQEPRGRGRAPCHHGRRSWGLQRRRRGAHAVRVAAGPGTRVRGRGALRRLVIPLLFLL